MNQAIYSLPRYAQIKIAIKTQIESGQWKVGERIPSENKLAEDFMVSRMTARRAVQELADEKLLLRSPGLGTFVAEPPAISSTLQITDFRAEFNQTNPAYSNRILALKELDKELDKEVSKELRGEKDIALLLGLDEGDPAFYSVVMHYRNSAAVQWEECFVNPQLAPAYLKQNFTKVTPQAYLDWVAPATRVEHQVQAVMPEVEIAGALGLPAISSCLKVSRRSWRGDKVVSVCRFIYPSSYSLGAELII